MNTKEKGSESRLQAAWRTHVPIALLMLCYGALILLTFRDYGITFDESWHAEYGRRILSWYRHGMSDLASLEAPIWYLDPPNKSLQNMSHYGGFFDALAEAASRWSPLGHYETRHLVNALFGMVGVLSAYLLARSLAGTVAGLLAALFMVATPFYYGHAFNNPKDIPFAVLYLASIYGIVRVGASFPRPRWRDMLALGAVIGVTMAVRFPGVVLLGLLALAFVLWAMGRPGSELISNARHFAGRFLACGVSAYLVMLPWWPAATLSPLRHPLWALRAMGSFPWNYPVRFDGKEILAPELPWYYALKYALLTFPEFVLLGLLVAALVALRAVFRNTLTLRQDVWRYGIVLAACIGPLFYAIVGDATLYDGLRHVIFALLPLIVLSACGFAVLVSHPSRTLALASGGALAFGLAFTAREMVRIHPYEYTYFNRVIAGGLARAQHSYETDYWGNSGKEAAEWMRARYEPFAAGKPIRVATCTHELSVSYYLPEGSYVMVGMSERPDLFVGTPRFGCWNELTGRVVHTVSRDGAPLAVVKEMNTDIALRQRSTIPSFLPKGRVSATTSPDAVQRSRAPVLP
jgi:hypothetical protein